MEHTKEPWRYDSQQGFCSELVGADGILIGAFVDNPTEADARRIVAAVNACAGFSIEELEAVAKHGGFIDQTRYNAKITKQRDDLVAACNEVRRCVNGGAKLSRRASDMVRAALASVEEGK